MGRPGIPKTMTGKGRGIDEKQVSPAQLRIGIAIEMEHTKDPALAKRIALDHLAENPRYYTYLRRMHRQMKVDDMQRRQQKKPAHTGTKRGKR